MRFLYAYWLIHHLYDYFCANVQNLKGVFMPFTLMFCPFTGNFVALAYLFAILTHIKQ